MIRHTSGPGTFAACVADHGGGIGVERGADGRAKTREAILHADDEVQQNVVEFSRGVASGWYGFAPLALSPSPQMRARVAWIFWSKRAISSRLASTSAGSASPRLSDWDDNKVLVLLNNSGLMRSPESSLWLGQLRESLLGQLPAW